MGVGCETHCLRVNREEVDSGREGVDPPREVAGGLAELIEHILERRHRLRDRVDDPSVRELTAVDRGDEVRVLHRAHPLHRAAREGGVVGRALLDAEHEDGDILHAAPTRARELARVQPPRRLAREAAHLVAELEGERLAADELAHGAERGGHGSTP